jgi:hypothetical protein
MGGSVILIAVEWSLQCAAVVASFVLCYDLIVESVSH